MSFHRYITPSYFGGLPVTHDLINVVSGGTGTGDGSAIVTGQKAGPHPNAGTYFVAFGEDGTSGHANRGLAALAENTDFLDDIVHADQSVPAVSATVVPGAPVAAAVIPGDIFVGSPGETNDQRTRSGLVAVLDGDGIPLHVLSGVTYVPVLVSKIQDGGGTSVLGTSYFSGPTVEFTPEIPSGQAYRLAYYTRSNLKSQLPNAYTRLANGIRGNEDLWAFAKTSRLANVTFTGVKIFDDDVSFTDDVTFDGPVLVNGTADFNGVSEFNNDTLFVTGTVEFNTATLVSDEFTFLAGSLPLFQETLELDIDDAEKPLILTELSGDEDPVPTQFKLITQFKLRDDVYARLYTSTTDYGYVVTINARWVRASSDWASDDTVEAASKFSLTGGDPLYWETKDAPLPASWSSWDGTSGAGLSQGSLRFGGTLHSEIADSGRPLYRSDSVSVDHPGEPLNQWKLLFQFALADLGVSPQGLKIRFYSGLTTGLTGAFCITTNAEWSPTAAEWSPDDDTAEAYQLMLTGTGTLLRHRTDTTSDWIEGTSTGGWDSVPSGNLGSFGISGEYGYARTRSRTKLINLAKGTAGVTAGAPDWHIPTGGVQWQSLNNIGLLFFPVDIPSGSTVTRVRAMVNPNAADPMSLLLRRNASVDFGVPTAPTTSTVSTVSSVGSALQTLDTGTISETITNDTEEYYIEILASISGASTDSLLAIEITYNDVGPRG